MDAEEAIFRKQPEPLNITYSELHTSLHCNRIWPLFATGASIFMVMSRTITRLSHSVPRD